MVMKVAARLRASDGLQKLAPGGRGAGEDVQLAAGPVRGHLPTARGRIFGCAHGLQKHGLRTESQGKAERPVAVVREGPVVAGAQVLAGRNQQGFVSGAGDLEVNFLLTLELDLAVIDATRKKHQPVE